MLEITPLTTRPCETARQMAAPAGTRHLHAPIDHGAGETQDRLELSPAADRFHEGPEQAAAMQERMRALRAHIADGTYLTPDKIEVVVDRLHAEIFGRAETGA